MKSVEKGKDYKRNSLEMTIGFETNQSCCECFCIVKFQVTVEVFLLFVIVHLCSQIIINFPNYTQS